MPCINTSGRSGVGGGRFRKKILAGLTLGVAGDLFLGEHAASRRGAANVFVRLLQMSVRPCVTVSLIVGMGTLNRGTARHDVEAPRFLTAWIDIKKPDGMIQALYDHWILGLDAKAREPRWSILRNVSGWEL
jgi:hypothetical protein